MSDKRWQANRWFKITVGVLCLAALTFALVFGSQALWLKAHGAYEREGQERLTEQVERELLWDQLHQLEAVCQEKADLFTVSAGSDGHSGRVLQPGALGEFDPNFFFNIRGENEGLLYAGGGSSRARVQESAWVSLTSPALNTEDGVRPVDRALMLTGAIRQELREEGTIYDTLLQAGKLYEQRDLLVALTGIGLAVGLLSLAALAWSAGHREGQPGITVCRLDRVPMELLLAALVALAVFLGVSTEQDLWGPSLSRVGLSLLILAAMLGLILSLVRRKKGGLLVRDAWLLSRLWRKAKPWRERHPMSPRVQEGLDRLSQFGGWIADHIPMAVKGLILFALLWVLEALSLMLHHPLPWIVVKVLEAVLVLRVLLQLRTLRDGGRRLAEGKPANVRLDTLRGTMWEHGDILNHFWQDEQTRVDQRMRGECLKTALITNAAQNIKAPLATIHNYVELLSQENLPTERSKIYLETLDHQTHRLKRLADHLAEASQAASGQVKAEIEPVAVNVLLDRLQESYQERMRSRSLTIVLKQDPSHPRIAADRGLLQRVIETLLSSVETYAQPGTRVYLSSQARGRSVHLIFRYITEEPINMSARELMTRLSQGDARWTAEGGGLELSLALSLTQLQHGTFDFLIDGDLIKVVLTFPLVAPAEPSPASEAREKEAWEEPEDTLEDTPETSEEEPEIQEEEGKPEEEAVLPR